MGLLSWFKGNKPDEETKKAMGYGLITGENQRPFSTQEEMMQLGINIHTIEDENVLSPINQLIKLAAHTNENGETFNIDLDLFALRNLVTKLIRTSRLDRIDAYIGMLHARRILRRIEMNMSDQLIEMGALNYIESVQLLLNTAFSDAIGGWKAKLLKVTPKTFEVTMASTKKPVWGMGNER